MHYMYYVANLVIVLLLLLMLFIIGAFIGWLWKQGNIRNH